MVIKNGINDSIVNVNGCVKNITLNHLEKSLFKKYNHNSTIWYVTNMVHHMPKKVMKQKIEHKIMKHNVLTIPMSSSCFPQNCHIFSKLFTIFTTPHYLLLNVNCGLYGKRIFIVSTHKKQQNINIPNVNNIPCFNEESFHNCLSRCQTHTIDGVT